MPDDNIQVYFDNLIDDNNIKCTQTELDNFVLSGLLFKCNKGYLTKNKTLINVDIIKDINYNMNINLANILCDSIIKAKENNTNKIYCMTQRCYNNYKEQGLIINKNNKDYYRLFNNELWLVSIIK